MPYLKGKDKNQILENIYDSLPGSNEHEQLKSAIIVRCTEDLEKALRETSESAAALSKKVYFLNWALVAATAVGAIATAVLAYKAFYGVG